MGWGGSSVEVGDDPVRDGPAVLVPGGTVRRPADGGDARVSVHQQDHEVDQVVPRQQVAEAWGAEESLGQEEPVRQPPPHLNVPQGRDHASAIIRSPR